MQAIKTAEQLAAFTGVLLFAAPWCNPCASYKPALEAACLRMKVELGVVDVDESRDLAKQFVIRAVPTTVYIRAGKEIVRKQGAQTVVGINALIMLGSR
jgi:thioredoxin-like negative regulator of GroEL